MRKLYILLFFLVWHCSTVSAQDKVLNQFKTFAANTTRERVYLHIAQHFAQPGGRIWFGAYVFDDGTQQLSAASKVLYVDVLDEQGAVILDEKIPLADGRGEGYLDIPDQMATGVYVVRAYTGWMRNFEAEHFFRDWLWVNLQPGAVEVEEDQVATFRDISAKIVAEGNLQPVAGLTARYVVEVTGKNKRGMAVSGEVVDDQGNVAATFTTNKYGYGAFILQAKKRRSYQVNLTTKNNIQAVFAMPDTKDEGLAMLLTAQPSAVRVSFQSTWEGKSGHSYRLILQSKGTIYLDQLLDFDKQPSQVLNISASQLNHGIYQLVLLNAANVAVAERVFQIYPAAGAPAIQLAASSFGRRDSQLAALAPATTSAYSVSISDRHLEGSYRQVPPQDVFFMSDVLEPNSTELVYFSDSNFRAPASWDLFLLTKTHPAYKWADIMKYTFSYPKWPYEKFISAYGQIRNADSLFLGQDLFTFYSFAHSEVIPVRTDDYGWFLLPLFDFSGPTNIIGLSDKKEISFAGMKIDIESGMPPTDLETGMIGLVASGGKPFSPLTRDKLVFKSSYKRLVPDLYPERKEVEPTKEFNPITRNTDDYMLDLREYLSFSSLSEVFIEIGRGIIVRERNGKKVIIMYDPVNSRGFEEPALIFINGIPTIDYELVLTLDPDIIETIKLYRSATAQERFGAMGRNGILSINTKGRALEIPSQENLSFTFNGFQPKARFSNEPGEHLPSVPDLRHQLYWQTGTALPANIQFTTSDILSDYEIRVVGVDAAGNWHISEQGFSTWAGPAVGER